VPIVPRWADIDLLATQLFPSIDDQGPYVLSNIKYRMFSMNPLNVLLDHLLLSPLSLVAPSGNVWRRHIIQSPASPHLFKHDQRIESAKSSAVLKPPSSSGTTTETAIHPTAMDD